MLPFAPCAAAARTAPTRVSAVPAGGRGGGWSRGFVSTTCHCSCRGLLACSHAPKHETHPAAPAVRCSTGACAAAGGAEVGVWRGAGDPSRPRAGRVLGVFPSLSPRPVRRMFRFRMRRCARRDHDEWLLGRPTPSGLSVRGQDPTRISHGVVSLPPCSPVLACHSFDATTPLRFAWLETSRSSQGPVVVLLY